MEVFKSEVKNVLNEQWQLLRSIKIETSENSLDRNLLINGEFSKYVLPTLDHQFIRKTFENQFPDICPNIPRDWYGVKFSFDTVRKFKKFLELEGFTLLSDEDKIAELEIKYKSKISDDTFIYHKKQEPYYCIILNPKALYVVNIEADSPFGDIPRSNPVSMYKRITQIKKQISNEIAEKINAIEKEAKEKGTKFFFEMPELIPLFSRLKELRLSIKIDDSRIELLKQDLVKIGEEVLQEFVQKLRSEMIIDNKCKKLLDTIEGNRKSYIEQRTQPIFIIPKEPDNKKTSCIPLKYLIRSISVLATISILSIIQFTVELTLATGLTIVCVAVGFSLAACFHSEEKERKISNAL